jgi:prepilin-type N-terminal cleavage/methylation domain-containing protein
MDRKKRQLQHNCLRSIRGFTLIELLIGLALSCLIAVVLFELLSSQNRTYSIQDDISEMQQNLRVAVERISRDVMSAGLGKPSWSTINGVDASSWYNTTNAYTPYTITSSGGNNTIDIIGCIETTVSRLSADAAAGSVTITLSAGEGGNFNTTTKQEINIGAVENAKVTGVAGDTLTIDTNPSSGGNQGLLYAQPTNTLVCLVKWVTYSLGGDHVLYINNHQGEGNQPLAQNITAMTISISGKLLTLNLAGSTSRPDRTTGQYMTTQVTNKVLLRN